MRIALGLWTYWLFVIHHTAAWPLLGKRDAPFEDVRTHQRLDHRKKDANMPDKYFHEANFHEHYDGRFAERQLSYEARRAYLVALVQTYLSSMNDIGIETFIMHGTLLGWYWNRRIMPWDDDIDVMVTEKSMSHLAHFYNMTVHSYKVPGVSRNRDYLLEVNPHYLNGTTADKMNRIDARWIDTDTGLFIDITTLHRNMTAQTLGEDGAMMVKDGHSYKWDDIFPLRESTFENFPAKVPYAYSDLLVEEYGAQALTALRFGSHRFDTEKKEWLALGCKDFGTCRYYRNRGEGFKRPADASEYEAVMAAAREALLNRPQLPFNPQDRPRPPESLNGQPCDGERWCDTN